MNVLIKFLRKHQIETYVLIVLPLTWILISVFCKNSLLSVFWERKQELALWSFFYGGKLISFGLMALYLYFYLRLITGIGCWVSKRYFNDTTAKTIEIKKFLLSFIYLIFVVGLGILVLGVSLFQISHSSSLTQIINNSELYFSMDKGVFGVIPQIWVQQFSRSHLLDYLLIESYSKISVFLAIVFLGLLLFKNMEFRKFLMAILIAPFLALPFWYLLPAVSPDELYRQNIYSLESVVPTQQQFEKAVGSEKLKTYLSLLSKETKKNQDQPIVSTNPSMHVAWGAIITYYSIVLWWPLGLIFIPWLMLNTVSTLYTMQHYAIDLPFGFLCAAIAIVITYYLFKIEKKYYTGTYTPFYFLNIIQEDMHYLKEKCNYSPKKPDKGSGSQHDPSI